MQCPVPGASGGSSRGSLGLKKNYSNITGDLLKSIQRTVYVNDPSAAEAATAVSELVLYDPAEHRLQLQQAQQEQRNTSSSQHPTKPATGITKLQPSDASHARAAAAGTAATTKQATTPDTATTAAAVTHKYAGPHQQPELPRPQQELASAAAAPVQPETQPQALLQEPAATGHEQQQQQQAQQNDCEFGINWSLQVKVYADLFLVEKLRPHQREGLK